MSAQKIACPHCQQMTSTESGFCDECGLELQAPASLKPITAAQIMESGTIDGARTCPFCGHGLRPNARHCPNCGKKLPRVDTPAEPEQPDSFPDSVLKVGYVIADRYGLESVLGQGGMGRAWKAFDRNLNKHVVIKTVVTKDEGLKRELAKEAQVLINIRHPNVVSVFDFFTVENELCYVMEYISGPSWADEIEEPGTRKLVLPMTAEQALLRIKGLLPAFKYLHELKPPIIYCDFKPSNVRRITLSNGEIIEVLLDFGTAYSYDPNVPPKPARGTPGYHSPQAKHPDWRDDYFTIGRTVAELIGMAEVHSEEFRYTLTPPEDFPWSSYDDSLRYFVEWLTAPERADRPQTVDEISEQIDGVLGYVRGQQPDAKAMKRQRQKANFAGVTVETMRAATQTGVVAHTAKIELPQVPHTNPASTVLLSAQEAYLQRDLTRALLLSNQAINNNGGAAALVLRSLVNNQLGNARDAAKDLEDAKRMADPQVRWETLLAEAQLLENAGRFEEAAENYRRMMALKPGDYRGRLMLAELYRRSGNSNQAINEYRAIIQAKPNVGAAYIGAAKAYLFTDQLDNAIKVLEDVSSRNASYNDVMLELIGLYNQKAIKGDTKSLEQAARAINVLQENGVESRSLYQLVAEFYFSAFQIARASGNVPQIMWPDEQIKTLGELSRANERAWREYLSRDDEADRDFIIHDRIMSARTWAII